MVPLGIKVWILSWNNYTIRRHNVLTKRWTHHVIIYFIKGRLNIYKAKTFNELQTLCVWSCKWFHIFLYKIKICRRLCKWFYCEDWLLSFSFSLPLFSRHLWMFNLESYPKSRKYKCFTIYDTIFLMCNDLFFKQ